MPPLAVVKALNGAKNLALRVMHPAPSSEFRKTVVGQTGRQPHSASLITDSYRLPSTDFTHYLYIDSTVIKVHPDGTRALKKTALKLLATPVADGQQNCM